MKPTLVFFFFGTLLPCRQGNQRFTAAVLEHLVQQERFKIKLIMVSDRPVAQTEYSQLCDELVCVQMSEFPRFLRLLNRLLRLPGIDLTRTTATSLWLRHRLRPHFEHADCILFNYATWFQMIPKSCANRTMVLTHDIVFFRLRSFLGDGPLAGIRVAVNRLFELHVLRKFACIIVLGDYEAELLARAGIPPDRIISIGMPLGSAHPPAEDGLATPYDFAFVGGDSAQNRMSLEHFARVCQSAAFRRANTWSLAIAGSIGRSGIARRMAAGNPRVRLLGEVDNLVAVYHGCKIVVGTIPKGSGIKVKVVEAMNFGKPVLATRKALEGIPCEHGKNVLILEEMEGILAGGWLDALLSDTDRLREIGRKAAENVRDVFSNERCLGPLERAIQRVAAPERMRSDAL